MTKAADLIGIKKNGLKYMFQRINAQKRSESAEKRLETEVGIN